MIQESAPLAKHPVDELLPFWKNLLFGLQHVLVMYAGAVAVPIIIGQYIGLSKGDITLLIQLDLFTCGIATIIQSMGLGKHIGIRLPVMLGVTFTAIIPICLIGKELGLPYVFGAVLVSAVFVILIAPFFSRIVSLLPPSVTGSVITVIGLSIMPAVVKWIAGGEGRPDFGEPVNFVVAFSVIIFITLITRFAKGLLSNISALLGLLLGCFFAFLIGKFDISGIAAESWISIPVPFHFGLPKFDISAILSMIVVNCVSMIESFGAFYAISEITGKIIGRKDITNGYRAEGLSMIIGSLFSSFPYTTFSENSGLVALSGIKSRFVLVAAGLILILLSVFQKVAFIIASIPNPVLGGASVIMFGLIAVIGIKTLAKIDFSKPENLLIPSVSIGLGVGVSAVPEIFKHFPESWRILFANGIVVGSLMAVLIYLFFHKWNSSSDTKG